jgi:glucosamine--fructose-6-phosphate aminotransferase (isomerizing)
MRYKDPIFEGAYLHEVLDQPKALALTLERLEIAPGLRSVAARMKEGEFRRIVLTGMGSSLYALYPLHLELTEEGYTSIIAETSELIHYLTRLLDPSTLIVAVSQSGESAEIVRLLEDNAGRATIIGVTNTPDGALASRAHCVLLTHAGIESSVSCKTYVTALMALRLLASVLSAQDAERERSDLSQAIPAAEAYLGLWEQHVAELRVTLGDVRHWILVGRGPSLATTNTGALTIEESIRVPAEGMSSAAFRHGPIEMLGPETFVLVFSGDKKGKDLNESLHDHVRELGYRSGLIGEHMDGAFRLPPAPAGVRTILEIMPVQMLIVALAARIGIEPGRFAIASKTTTRE